MRMRRIFGVLCITALLVTACGSPSDEQADPGADSPELMAAALLYLVENDHTFGDGPPPFTKYLVRDSIDPNAGTGPGNGAIDTRLLTDEEKESIESALSVHGTVEFIEGPADWLELDLRPVVEGSAILGVGEPRLDGEDTLVPVALSCGAECGKWLTYRLELLDGRWSVTSPVGTTIIS